MNLLNFWRNHVMLQDIEKSFFSSLVWFWIFLIDFLILEWEANATTPFSFVDSMMAMISIDDCFFLEVEYCYNLSYKHVDNILIFRLLKTVAFPSKTLAYLKPRIELHLTIIHWYYCKWFCQTHANIPLSFPFFASYRKYGL